MAFIYNLFKSWKDGMVITQPLFIFLSNFAMHTLSK